MTAPSPLLRPPQVAQILGISTAMVYELARSGKIVATTFSAWPGKRGTVRFTSEAVQAFISEHTGEMRTG